MALWNLNWDIEYCSNIITLYYKYHGEPYSIIIIMICRQGVTQISNWQKYQKLQKDSFMKKKVFVEMKLPLNFTSTHLLLIVIKKPLCKVKRGNNSYSWRKEFKLNTFCMICRLFFLIAFVQKLISYFGKKKAKLS